ncbi:MAG: cysteine hydrolase [Candidatus Poribacteria bacterium]|nr:cysteine hydrolase [Candidatus Poribacteria bacterium]
MARQVFVDIDTQIDFINSDGALSVPGAEQIRGNLRALTNHALENGIKIIASADAHPVDDKEFELFPPHCVQGTPGQKKIEETSVANTHVVKNAPAETPSRDLLGKADQVLLEKQAFDVFTNPNAAELVKAAEADEHIVYGVATDYCVKAAVLGLLEQGHTVVVIEDAIAAVEAEAGKEALALMREKGAIFKKTTDIISA